MGIRLSHRGFRTAATIVIILGVITFWVLRPVRQTDFTTPGFTPLRDDALAVRFAPIILKHDIYGSPSRLLYRMARNATGEIFIAYHPLYLGEENPHSGFGAFMSRTIYTGGLHLKDIMFGPADVELIEVILSERGIPKLVAYEDVEKYDTKSFSVKHLPKTQINPQWPLCFETTTWNHLFTLTKTNACKNINPLTPEYFSENEWLQYKMVKKTEAILRRSRAHRVYERLPVR